MLKLRRVIEAVDSSRSSIMYNLAERLNKKGIKAFDAGDKGLRIDFILTEKDDPSNHVKDKSFVFKGDGLKGSFYWDITKQDSDGKRKLTTKDVMVNGSKDLIALQKKLKADKPDNGKLTGRCVKPFKAPEPYVITNLVSSAFQTYLKNLYKQIIEDVALALSEEVELDSSKKEKKERYFIEYDENFNRVNEGYITESDDTVSQKKFSWKDSDVQKAIMDVVKGLKVDTSKTTDKELIFTLNNKNGSLHLQGYMLVLDTDTDDDIPATNYPVKDKNNLTLDNLLETIKVVFSRRESIKKESYDINIEDSKEPLKEGDAYYVLKGHIEEAPDGFYEDYEEIVGNIEGYHSKDDAINAAVNLRYEDPKHLYGVTEIVPLDYFKDDVFWDIFADGDIKIIWDTQSLNNPPMDYENDVIEEKRMDEDIKEEHDIDDYSSPVFQDVAKERFMEKLSKSLSLAPEYTEECAIMDACKEGDLVWLYLSPSYAIDQVTDIIMPLCIKGHLVSLPALSIPNPDSVFSNGYTENTMIDYDNAIQHYILNDAPMSDIANLSLDNTDEVKAQVVDLVNAMADEYLEKKKELEDHLDYKGEALLKESRYFIVPSDTDLTSTKDVIKITPLGYTDLSIARSDMKDLSDSGRYNFDLKILDTNFSNNKEKWSLL